MMMRLEVSNSFSFRICIASLPFFPFLLLLLLLWCCIFFLSFLPSYFCPACIDYPRWISGVSVGGGSVTVSSIRATVDASQLLMEDRLIGTVPSRTRPACPSLACLSRETDQCGRSNATSGVQTAPPSHRAGATAPRGIAHQRRRRVKLSAAERTSLVPVMTVIRPPSTDLCLFRDWPINGWFKDIGFSHALMIYEMIWLLMCLWNRWMSVWLKSLPPRQRIPSIGWPRNRVFNLRDDPTIHRAIPMTCFSLSLSLSPLCGSVLNRSARPRLKQAAPDIHHWE